MKNILQRGYVALIAVLVMGAVAVTVTSALLYTGVDSQREIRIEQSSAQALHLSTACVEDALQSIKNSSPFTGSGSVTLATGSCSFVVASTGTSTRTIDATSTVNNVTRKIKVYVTINLSSLSITSWQDII